MPLTYPAWFSAPDRVRIDDALRAAFGSGEDAMRAALAVFEAVAQTLHARRGSQSVEAVQAAADDLLDQIIVWADGQRPSSAATRDAFAAAVREAVRQQAWWTPTLLAPSAVPRPRPADEPNTDRHPGRKEG
jgi:predicted amidohydrolase YtcJ